MTTPKSQDQTSIEEEEVSEAEKPYPWTANIEQAWRAFIIDAMANADIDGKVLVENMQTVYEWGISGKVKGQKSRQTPALELSGKQPPPGDK